VAALLNGRKNPFLTGLLHSIRGRSEGGAIVLDGPPTLLEKLRQDHGKALQEDVEKAAGRPVEVRFGAPGEKKSPGDVTCAAPGAPKGDPLERKALEDPLVQEFLREFDGIFVKFLPAPAGSAPAGAAPVETVKTEFDNDEEELSWHGASEPAEEGE
jgi:hypothetical protein